MSLFGVLLIFCHLEIPDREELLRLVDEAKAKITGQWGSKLFYLCHFLWDAYGAWVNAVGNTRQALDE